MCKLQAARYVFTKLAATDSRITFAHRHHRHRLLTSRLRPSTTYSVETDRYLSSVLCRYRREVFNFPRGTQEEPLHDCHFHAICAHCSMGQRLQGRLGQAGRELAFLPPTPQPLPGLGLWQRDMTGAIWDKSRPRAGSPASRQRASWLCAGTSIL